MTAPIDSDDSSGRLGRLSDGFTETQTRRNRLARMALNSRACEPSRRCRAAPTGSGPGREGDFDGAGPAQAGFKFGPPLLEPLSQFIREAVLRAIRFACAIPIAAKVLLWQQ